MKYLFWFGGFLILSFPLLLFGINTWVERVSQPWLFAEPEQVPHNRVGLVLGTGPTTVRGRPNPYFVGRIQAAAQLYRAGKVDYLLVSGDNSSRYYDEPTAMRKALIALGVPQERIYRDYAGFRTLDSVVRAKEVFGEQRFTIVSQRFHNQRAVFIARQRGLEAIGFNAPDVPEGWSNTWFREPLARVQMALDLLLNRQPKYLGEPVRIGVDPVQ
ncbi:ElyC/SanA/YdcF family protein [Meiothermus sp.]|uniref:SanA/YdcF family protein n=1 Tax=Meiothermus sp. TaxID=1955249 RepID=UPI00307D72D3